MTKFALALVFAPVALAAAPAANAQMWAVGDHSMHVYFTGLDGGTHAGRAAMLDRVEKAATRLCGDQPVRTDQRQCIADTVAQTARAVGGAPIAIALNERRLDAIGLASR